MTKSLIDQRIEEALEDICKGRTYGPFDTAEQMIESLERNLEKRKTRDGSSQSSASE